MKNRNLMAALGLSAVLFVGACGGGKSDADLTKEVQTRVKQPGVTTTVKDGVVTLTGTVETQEASKAAEAAAKGDGVKSVTNSLMIKPAATPMTSTTTTTTTTGTPMSGTANTGAATVKH